MDPSYWGIDTYVVGFTTSVELCITTIVYIWDYGEMLIKCKKPYVYKYLTHIY